MSRPALLARGALFLFVLAGILLAHGYQFPASNHVAELPPVLARIEGTLYEKDFYVQEMLRFTPRVYYQYAMAILAQVGVGVGGAHFLLYVAALAAFILGVRAVAHCYVQREAAAAILLFWSLSATAGTLAGNVFWPSSPIPTAFAMGFAIWGIYFSLRRRWVAAFALLAGACLFQLLVGVLPALLVAPFLIRDLWKRRQWGQAALAILLLGTGAGLVYLPMAVQGTTSTELISNAAFVEIYGFLRHPHHIVPSAWPWTEWVQVALFYGAGLWSLQRTPDLPPGHRYALTAIVAVAILGLGLNYLFVEVWPWALVAKLQFSRMTSFAQFAILAGLLPMLKHYLHRRHWMMVTVLVVLPVSHVPGLLLLVFLVGQRRLEAWSAQRSVRQHRWGSALLFLVLYRFPFSSALPAWLEALASGPILLGVVLGPVLIVWWAHEARRRLLMGGALAVLAWGMLIVLLSGAVPARVGALTSKHLTTRGVWEGELIVLARRFQMHSDKEALVLVPPTAAPFRLLSRRSVVVDFKAFPYTDRGMVEWKERMDAVWSCANRSPDCLVAVARRYGAGYLLTHDDELALSLIDQEGAWRIWRVSANEDGR